MIALQTTVRGVKRHNKKLYEIRREFKEIFRKNWEKNKNKYILKRLGKLFYLVHMLFFLVLNYEYPCKCNLSRKKLTTVRNYVELKSTFWCLKIFPFDIFLLRSAMLRKVVKTRRQKNIKSPSLKQSFL
jgi:hypothetical protein